MNTFQNIQKLLNSVFLQKKAIFKKIKILFETSETFEKFKLPVKFMFLFKNISGEEKVKSKKLLWNKIFQVLCFFGQ